MMERAAITVRVWLYDPDADETHTPVPVEALDWDMGAPVFKDGEVVSNGDVELNVYLADPNKTGVAIANAGDAVSVP
jgi:hypothetical protein